MKQYKTNDLSYPEFEILQILVTNKDISLPDLSDSLKILNTSEIIEVINALTKKSMVQTTAKKLKIQQAGLLALEPYRVKQAVILAAGLGRRMQPETHHTPKPLVQVRGKRIIETQLDALMAANIPDITIVRGYLGDQFDILLEQYPNLKFIDNPNWESEGAIISVNLAKDLLANAYIIEGDLYIKNPQIIRQYEYHCSYCGIPDHVTGDWYFKTDGKGRIQELAHGESEPDSYNTYRFVGIMHWTSEHAVQLKTDLDAILQIPENRQRFIESVPFDQNSSIYDIFVRSINPDDVTEIDTYAELMALRNLGK